jgi:hypothetical protein
MLKNRYEEILVGLNLMSLVRGLISRRRNRSVLLIDDHRFAGDSYPLSFLSEMEVLALLRLGKKYDIPELNELRKFLIPASLSLITSEVRFEQGVNPLQNLRELLRKYPELIDPSDLDLVFAERPEDFNQYFKSELQRFESLCSESSPRPKAHHFDLQGPKWFKNIYLKLSELLNREYSESKNLKYSGLLQLLGVAAEERLKTRLAPEEIPFYFFRLLSPVYRLQDFFISTQLKRRLLLLGGDFKESDVQYWQIHNYKFENLLLASFEGVISGERVLFFSHLPEEVPFKIESPFPLYRKNQVTPLRQNQVPFPPSHLTLIANCPLLGSERPYRALAAAAELDFYHWPYPDLPGSKAEFYDKESLLTFEQDAADLPFEKRESFCTGINTVTMDMRQNRETRKQPIPVLTALPLQIVQNDHKIQGFEYWGIFRYRSLGILALCYGVEEI